ncbi:MAG: DUF433 domain-containing protein [Deltaproteobacteria bacterium]|nr:DUF433 domain-containing protein [Deltaproteobacteria bacterium]
MRTTAPVDMVRNGYRYVRLPMWVGYDELLIDQRVQFGEPCVRGTRIPAVSIATFHAAGDSILSIARMLNITEAQVQACLDYVNAPVKCSEARV